MREKEESGHRRGGRGSGAEDGRSTARVEDGRPSAPSGDQGIIWRAPPFESVKTESPPATQEARF